MQALSPTPPWTALPEQARHALTAAGFGADWYGRGDESLRWTLLLVFAKLQALDLWRFVGGDVGTSRGTLNFACRDRDGLVAALQDRSDFTTPRSARPYWQSRELRMHAALHFKHFAGWPADHVQAHVDGTGLWLRWPWWLTVFAPVVQIARHFAHYHSYLDLEGRRRQLVAQGIGQELLAV